MKHEYKNIRISECDAVMGSAGLNVVVNTDSETTTIKPLDGSGPEVALSNSELADLLKAGTFSIEYGYFSDRQARRRAVAGRQLLSRLPSSVKNDVFFKECCVTTFIEMEEEDLANRSSKRWSEFAPELWQRINAKLKAAMNDTAPSEWYCAYYLRRLPCRTSVMKWVRTWEKAKDPAALVKSSIFNGANAQCLSPEVEAIVQSEIEAYLHPNRRNARAIFDAVNGAIKARNEKNVLTGAPPLEAVSQSTVERRIRERDQFEVLAAREGVAVAKNKLGATGGGLNITAPLQRIEMDEWEIDLIAILKGAGAAITDPAFRDLELGRYWICVAIDAASRSILGLKLSKTPTAEDAKAVLWMAMRNKTKLARQLGCETDWKQHGHIYHVAVDNGPAFVNSEFKAALSDLCIDYSVLPAGIAKLRGLIERFFRTMAEQLMPELTGRTFSNTQERGDFPSQTYAVHTAEGIIEALLRFTAAAIRRTYEFWR